MTAEALRRRTLLVAAAAAVLTTIAALPVNADPPAGDKALAESLFQAAKDLMKSGRTEEACPKFAESNRIDPSPGTLLNLGKCYEATGKTASAWVSYKEAVVMARAAGQAKRVEAGQQFLADVEPKLSKLRIDADKPAPGLQIRFDGVVVGTAAIGVAVARDPGEHVVEASAPGYQPWSTKVTIGPNADQKSVTIPPLERAPETASTGAPDAGAASPPSSPEPSDQSAQGDGSGRRALGWVVGGVGVAAAAVGAVFGVMTLSAASSAESDPSLCPDKRCSTAGLNAIDAARTKATISTIGFGVGLAAIGAGVVLIATAPSGSKHSVEGARRSRVRMAPAIGPTSAWLTGAF